MPLDLRPPKWRFTSSNNLVVSWEACLDLGWVESVAWDGVFEGWERELESGDLEGWIENFEGWEKDLEALAGDLEDWILDFKG